MKDEFKATFVVDLAPETVWEALISRTAAGDPRDEPEAVHYVLPGFPSFVPLDVPGARCTLIESEPGRLLRVRKDHEPCAGTEIAVRLEQEETGTRVTVVQSGFGPWFRQARDAIYTHGAQIISDFRLYIERRVTAPGTVWGADLGAQTRHTPVGLEIAAVNPGGFAESAGLRPGDLLLSLRGIRLHNTEQLWTVLALTDTGSTADVTWVRGRTPMQGKAALAGARSDG